MLGLLVLRYLDNTVDDARWLSDEEKAVVRADLAAEEATRECGHGSIRAALTSGRVCLLCGIYFTIALGIYLVSFWLPTIIKNSGVADPLTIGLLTAVPYVGRGRGHDRVVGARRPHRRTPLAHADPVPGHRPGPRAHGGVPADHRPRGRGDGARRGRRLHRPGRVLEHPVDAALRRRRGGRHRARHSIGNIGGAVATSLVGRLSDLTGSTASSLYPFGAVLFVGGLLVLLVPRSVDDRSIAARTPGEDLPSPR